MFDLKQLDNLFNDDSLKKQISANEAVLQKQRKRIRIIKICFPAIAAALIGILAVLPNLQERDEFSIQISKPTRQELEKLHMENTVLYVTDKANRVNSFTAENIDETAPGSQLVKFKNPVGKIPTSDTEWLDITAPTGFYNQKTKLISLNEDVNIKHNSGTVGKTSEMFYDSNKSLAYGSKPTIIEGDSGTINAQGFKYYTNKEHIIFTGKTEIHTSPTSFGEKTDIYADKTVEYFKTEQKLIAKGNAIVKRSGMNINGEIITAVFIKQNDKTQINDFTAQENVSVDNNKNKVYSDYLKAFFKLSEKKENVIDRIEMTGNVKTKTADGEVYADKAIYYPNTGKVELFENVVIVKDGNRMQGTKAETNLNTGASKIFAGKKNRVSGVFYEGSIEK
ncbi:MAG: LPS export ABC transporter periplasmic protein LptC [Alphaproteobacteria bacterium]|nr:LPS export ABC transporter periplasmic protein LptC [Alphaproteobacteria bacterium]